MADYQTIVIHTDNIDLQPKVVTASSPEAAAALARSAAVTKEVPRATNSSVALLLEDEPLIAMDLEVALEAAGFHVSTAMSCTEALCWLDERSPDVVIVDVELKDGRSSNVVMRLIERRIPFVVHSGDNPKQFSNTPFAQGKWVNKPAGADEVIDAARVVMTHGLSQLSPGDLPAPP